jgi:hypothetical protein
MPINIRVPIMAFEIHRLSHPRVWEAGDKTPVDSRDALAGNEKQDEKHGKDRTEVRRTCSFENLSKILFRSRFFHVILPNPSGG